MRRASRPALGRADPRELTRSGPASTAASRSPCTVSTTGPGSPANPTASIGVPFTVKAQLVGTRSLGTVPRLIVLR